MIKTKSITNSTTRPTDHQLAPTNEFPVESQQALPKLNDPGKFLLSCLLENTILNNCLCDLGASISLMPLSLANQLNLTDFKKCTTPLVFADKSTRPAYGILEDVPLKIGNTEVPTDFVVLDFGDNHDNQLLLGRPFLASVGAQLDLKNVTIKLDLGKPGFTIFDLHGTERRNLTNNLRPAAPNEKASPPLSASTQ